MSYPVGPSTSSLFTPPTYLPDDILRKVQSFLGGYQQLSGSELVELLKNEPRIGGLYKDCFDTTTGVTAEQESVRILNAFIERYENEPRISKILKHFSMNKAQFMMLLALHSIARVTVSNLTYLSLYEASVRSSEQTRQLIEPLCNQWNGEKVLLKFNHLLYGLETLVHLIEERRPELDFLFHAMSNFRTQASKHEIGTRDHLDLITFFYTLTYPNIPSEILVAKLNLLKGLIAQRKGELYRGVRDDISDEAIQLLFKESVWDYTQEEMQKLERVLTQVKIFRWEDVELYQKIKNLVLQLRMAHLPMRVYAMWKHADSGFSRTGDFFKDLRREEKSSRRIMKQKLKTYADDTGLHERMKLLSRLTFIHGTTSAALAMMLKSDNPSLVCTGDLLSQNIAPMYGELHDGIAIDGINNRWISAETIRNVNRIIGYTELDRFHPENLRSTFNPFNQLYIYEVERLYKLILGLNRWKELFPEEYAVKLAPGALIYTWIKDYLTQQVSRFRENLELCQSRFEINKITNYYPRETYTDDINKYTTLVREFSQFIANLEAGQLQPSHEINTDEIYGFEVDDYVAKIRNPLTMLTTEKLWNSMAVGMIQMKQWDLNLFKELILPRQQEWIDAFNQEFTKVTNPLYQALAIIDHQFTEEELTYISQLRSGVGSSSETIPPSLLSIIPTTRDVPPLPTDLNDYCNRDTLSQLPRQLYYYRTGSYTWNKLFKELLYAKLKCEDISMHRSLFETAIAKIEKSFSFIMNAVKDSPANFQFPEDEMFRSLFTNPIPIIFSSTHVFPRPSDKSMHPSEYTLKSGVELGKNGCDILFTDTVESVDRIRSVLPDRLREEIEIHLFEELSARDLLLIHSKHRINYDL